MTPLEMNPEIRQRWVAALRSGEYKQGKNHLRTADGWCCLGVLCELAVADGVVPTALDPVTGVYGYGGAESMLPPAVKRWASVKFAQRPLALANDGWTDDGGQNHPPLTFAQIADLIEGTPAGGES